MSGLVMQPVFEDGKEVQDVNITSSDELDEFIDRHRDEDDILFDADYESEDQAFIVTEADTHEFAFIYAMFEREDPTLDAEDAALLFELFDQYDESDEEFLVSVLLCNDNSGESTTDVLKRATTSKPHSRAFDYGVYEMKDCSTEEEACEEWARRFIADVYNVPDALEDYIDYKKFGENCKGENFEIYEFNGSIFTYDPNR